jgi:branched-chain amino acid transport system ATP-binding protein
MNNVLEVSKVSRRFGGVQAVADLDLTVKAGEVVALVGPNGAGKSTVINLITGVYLCDGGAIRFAGEDVTPLAADARARRGLARTFQTPQYFPNLTLTQNAAIGAHRHAPAGLFSALWPTRSSRERVQQIERTAVETMRLVGVKGDPNRMAASMSYGDQKRLEFARALLLRPTLLLLDEPAAGLDPSETHEIGAAIRRAADSQGIAVLLVEHDMKLVRAVADRIVVLDQGRMLAAGEPEAVLADPLVLKAYLGSTALASAVEVQVA